MQGSISLAPGTNCGDAVQGVLMVDRYIAYKIMRQVKEGKLLLAFCWAHVRRDFVRVGKGYPELTAWALTWLRRIRELYRLNRQRLRHPRETTELNWYLEVCAASGGKPPVDPASFLPWNLSATRLADLRSPTSSPSAADSS